MTKAATKTAVKSRRPTAKPKASAAKDPLASPPDTSVLKRLSPDRPETSHPAWLKKEFPAYFAKHAHAPDSSVRELTHKGHKIRIVTTYKILVDGKEIHPNLVVDNGGRVYSHATPFSSYESALDLVSAVIDQYPDAFTKTPAAGRSKKHAGH